MNYDSRQAVARRVSGAVRRKQRIPGVSDGEQEDTGPTVASPRSLPPSAQSMLGVVVLVWRGTRR